MRTSLSVRGVLVLPLVVAVFGAFACTGSPTQPDLIADTATGSRPRSFDESSPFSPAQVAQDEFAEPEYAEELTDESELTEDAGDVEEIDAADLGASNLDASDFEPHSLTSSTPTAAATAGKVTLTGVIKDKTTKRAISGVMVKITGLQPVTSNSKGVYRIQNVGKGSRTLKFSKNGYATTSVTRSVTRAMTIDVLMTASGAALSSVSLSDNDVPVGTVVNGTVTLNKAAPSGGAKISLSSTSPATAAVQSSVITVPAGKKTGAFKVNAKAGGTAVIKATYNGSKTANLKVTGGGQNPPPPTTTVPPPPPTNTTPVATFDYSPSQCLVVANPAGGVLATCTFDASDSTAPAGSTYKWTFPGGNVFNRTSATFTNVPLPCGTLPNGVFDRTITLTVTTPSGAVSVPFPRSVTFTKTGLC